LNQVCKHPNVVCLLGVCLVQEGNNMWLVMEIVGGGDLLEQLLDPFQLKWAQLDTAYQNLGRANLAQIFNQGLVRFCRTKRACSATWLCAAKFARR
jgi:serine/threonine protein kinase